MSELSYYPTNWVQLHCPRSQEPFWVNMNYVVQIQKKEHWSLLSMYNNEALWAQEAPIVILAMENVARKIYYK